MARLRHLYLDDSFEVGLGAQTALELQAGTMLTKLAKGFAVTPAGPPEFFAVHQVDEPEHERAMLDCVDAAGITNGDFEAGFVQCLDAFAAFWSGVALLARRTTT